MAIPLPPALKSSVTNLGLTVPLLVTVLNLSVTSILTSYESLVEIPPPPRITVLSLPDVTAEDQLVAFDFL